MKKSVGFLLSAIFALVFFSGCGSSDKVKWLKSPDLSAFDKIGMLSTGLGSCLIPEGCGPKYRLVDAPDLSERHPPYVYTPLLGDIDDDHDQLMIGVIGQPTVLPPEEYGDMNYDGPTDAIAVKSYALLSKIKYHDFLMQEATEYTQQTYGCTIVWNKTFSWEMSEDGPILKIRLFGPFIIEMRYNGNTGEFIEEENNLDGYDPCPFLK